jgi:hypothetical protein
VQARTLFLPEKAAFQVCLVVRMNPTSFLVRLQEG